MYSYDLDLDQRLSEETTVLVENYTVSAKALDNDSDLHIPHSSCQTAA